MKGFVTGTAVVVALIAVLTSASAAYATFSGENGRIAFPPLPKRRPHEGCDLYGQAGREAVSCR